MGGRPAAMAKRSARRALRRRAISTAIGGALLCGAASAQEFDERVRAEPGGRLVAELDGGRVEIESHGEDEVRVEAQASGFGAGAADFRLERRGSQVSLRTDLGGVLGWIGGQRVRVRIRVPEEFSLDLRSGGGDVEIEEIEGTVEVRTRGGRVRVREVTGGVELHTSGGTIEAEEIEGDVVARTSGGAIRAVEIEGSVDVETSGGGIEVYDVAGRVRARTSGGPISVRFTGAPSGDIETSGGGIEVELPEGEGLRLEAQTQGGRVELDRPLALEGRIEPTRIEADVNGGGPLLRLHTSGGDIRVRVR